MHNCATEPQPTVCLVRLEVGRTRGNCRSLSGWASDFLNSFLPVDIVRVILCGRGDISLESIGEKIERGADHVTDRVSGCLCLKPSLAVNGKVETVGQRSQLSVWGQCCPYPGYPGTSGVHTASWRWNLGHLTSPETVSKLLDWR